MNPQDEDHEIFTLLGLTIMQAKVYLATAELGQTKATIIAKKLQVDRAEIYRATKKLEKLGLIQKTLGTPIIFRAAPMSEGLAILLEQNAKKHNELQAKAKKIVEKFKEYDKEKPSQEEEVKYVLKPEAIGDFNEFTKALRNSQMSIDMIVPWTALNDFVLRYTEMFKEAIKRGVKFRAITHISQGTRIPLGIRTLNKTGFFEIRHASTIPQNVLHIFDKKVTHIVSMQKVYSTVAILQSTDTRSVAMYRDYFELKWQSATTPCWHRKTSKLKHNLKRCPRRVEHEEKEMKPTSTFIS